ncbi:amidohydrolase [Blastococcus saxobsidens]|uniref:Amidohydrolase n=1 Tax=Blastococcus saxobsidens (strain DD2) TaxID=1146883 RepID=H6RX11_BLASD|nr:amidohydrolase family protein [Blastococcus saxobsidens]CCG03419.1 Amidohydrolase [Blastococcus saxobsidens DD2]
MTTRLFVNGKVFTGTGEDDFASAFRITDGAFSWVGDTADVTGEEATDLGGATVLPGFLDVHAHPSFTATLADAVPLLPPDVDSLAALLDRLRAHPDIGTDRWIEGFGFDESRYPERRKPTASDLDAVSATQPIVVRRCDGHSVVCNSRALELAGITPDTPDPENGRIGRDASGTLTGLLAERAAFDAVLALRPPLKHEELVTRLAGLNRRLLARGIVAVDDLMATFVPEPLRLYRDAEQASLVPQCGLYYGWTDVRDSGMPDLSNDDRTGRMRVAGLKVLMDGAYSDRTAWTDDAYPGTCDHGIRTCSDDELRAAVAWARRNRIQVAIHAMGDRALHRVVDVVGDEEPWMGERPSVRLEHATLFSAELLDRLEASRMSFGVVSHSIFFFAEYDSYARSLSPQQLAVAYPIRSFYERVPATALSSDHPATAWSEADDVFVSIKAAVLRQAHNGASFNPAEAVTVAQAILLYTGRAAGVSPIEPVGVIRPGAEGTFVVLERDVFSVPSSEIDQVRVAETWVRGERAFRR